MELPESYKEEMRTLLGENEYCEYLKSLEEPSFHGIRINGGKVKPEDREKIFSALKMKERRMVPWSGTEGFYYGEETFPARHPYYYGGLYYLQEPSAMAPGTFLPVEPGDKVLDLCAAPGGKSTQLGARLSGKGLLLSNDISASRAKGLLKNLELFGIGNAFVSSEDPEKLLSHFPEFFNKILVDAPCSGEGMFRRDPSMVKSWAEKGPAVYAPIQKRLLFLAAGMLKPGGMLLYSTCTFAGEEDEDNIRWLLKEVPELEPVVLKPSDGISRGFDESSLRLFPWKLSGEGHFVSLLRKKPGEEDPEERKTSEDKKLEEINKRRKKNELFLKKKKSFSEFLRFISRPLEEEGYFWEREGQIYLLPIPPEALPRLRFLRTGLHMGTMKKERFEPSQALAMYLKGEEFANGVSFSAEDPRTVKYLKGETVEASEDNLWGDEGWCLVCTDGYPLGFAKRSRMTLKNKYYPGWRWQ